MRPRRSDGRRLLHPPPTPRRAENSRRRPEIGTHAHGYIEWTLRRERGEVVGPEPRISDKALWAFMVWQDWQAGVKLRPLAIEQVVWSTTHRYAGTLDFLAEITLPGHAGAVPAVVDIKTGKAIYGEARLQVSAYSAALREMEHAPPGVWGAVVRLPKVETDPAAEIQLICSEEQRELFQTFMHVKALWDWQQAQRLGAA
jgi:hypothetical protein